LEPQSLMRRPMFALVALVPLVLGASCHPPPPPPPGVHTGIVVSVSADIFVDGRLESAPRMKMLDGDRGRFAFGIAGAPPDQEISILPRLLPDGAIQLDVEHTERRDGHVDHATVRLRLLPHQPEVVRSAGGSVVRFAAALAH
jgi:hypothetical protein